MINNVAKLLKNVNSLHQAEIATRHTSHEKNKQIHGFGLLLCQEIRFKKPMEKNLFQKAWKSATQNNTKQIGNFACCIPKSNKVIIRMNLFFSQ